jgi:hypothetical protein
MIPSGKMNKKQDQVERIKARGECGSSDPAKDSHEARMDKMSRQIRNLINKM